MARGTIISKKLENGEKRYVTVLRINGKQQWKTHTRKKDAEGYLDKNSTDVREHTYREIIPATFKQYADQWRKKYLIPQELKPSTLNGYNSNLERHLLPRFGTRPMTAITTADVTDFRADLLKSGQAAKSVKNLMNLLSRFFADAQEENYLKVSPMPQRRHRTDNQSKGKSGKKGRALLPEQAQMLLTECDADPEQDRPANPDLRSVILIALLAGLRRGEIFALHFRDVDWQNNVIRVRGSLFWRHGKYQEVAEGEPSFVICGPKSETSVRDVDLSPALKKELRTRYLQSEDKNGLIFQSANATPLDPHNVYERWFKPAVERARAKAEKEKDQTAEQAFNGLRLHDLRHTFGSWKVAQGEDILYVSAQMGHARPSITADVYSHLLEKRRPEAATRTDAFLFGKKIAAAE